MKQEKKKKWSKKKKRIAVGNIEKREPLRQPLVSRKREGKGGGKYSRGKKIIWKTRKS